MPRPTLLVTCLALFLISPAFADEAIEQSFQTIANVGKNGAGSAEARRAQRVLAAGGASLLPRLLEAMDTPNIVAANWYRSAFEQIVARESTKPRDEQALPIELLKQFAADPARQGRVRQMALRMLDGIEPNFRARLLPKLLNDPEFRDEAVELVLKNGDEAKKAGDEATAKTAFETAFANARDSSQVTRAAEKLKSIGVEMDIIRHMGFVNRWYLLGPFDAPGMSGFERVFPPEKNLEQIDLSAEFAGQNGAIRWKLFETPDRLGQVNLIQAVAPVKEAAGFAYAELASPREQHVQLRCGADDNLTVWLNGKKIFSRLQWLNGTRLDRFAAEATLKPGKNRVLVKICQGPQHKNPAVPNNWSVQVRFCDESGAGADFKNLLPRPE